MCIRTSDKGAQCISAWALFVYSCWKGTTETSVLRTKRSKASRFFMCIHRYLTNKHCINQQKTNNMKRIRFSVESIPFFATSVTLLIMSIVLLHFHLFSSQTLLLQIWCGFIGFFIALAAIILFAVHRRKQNRQQHYLNISNTCKFDLLKAQFTQYILFYGGDDKQKLLHELNTQFDEINHIISSIDSTVCKDDLLCQAGKILYGTTNANETYNKITQQLQSATDCTLVRQLSGTLLHCSDMLKQTYTPHTEQ